MLPSTVNGVQAKLPQRVYRFRMLGMCAAALAIAPVLQHLGWSRWTVTLVIFTGVLWPQLARWIASRSRDPYRAEVRNLLGDSLLAGLWVPLMHFNLLPSVLLVTVATADKLNSGVRGLWLRALPAMALGVLVGGLFTGFAVELMTTTAIVLASLPLMVVHTLAVSIGTYHLIRRLQLRNRQLLALSQQDSLTGLANRRHWHAESIRRLADWRARGVQSTLLMVDMDRLKAINDQYGHAAGDAALGTLGSLIRACAGEAALTGRLGGDEFAALLPCAATEATAIAERLRVAVAAARWAQWPALRCTISLGLSEASDADTLPELSEAADGALYVAKEGGRNRSADGASAGAFGGLANGRANRGPCGLEAFAPPGRGAP